MRGFEKIKLEEFIKTRSIDEYDKITLPKRSTDASAGYDFFIPYEISLEPKESIVISTGIKSYMNNNEVLLIFIRSSLGFKHGIRLKNQTGVIDSDYYNNENNEGHILIAIENTGNNYILIKQNDRVAQGVFINYLISENEEKPQNNRIGGIGSTKK